MVLDDSIEITETVSNGKNFQQLYAAVNRYCLSLTGSTWDADDLAQDTWLKALGKLIDFGHPNLEAFLLRIAKNTWIDQSRRKANLAEILKRERPQLTLQDHSYFEIETALLALMKHLSPLQRTVFLLRGVFGYSITEVSKILETTEGAVKAAFFRARQALEQVKKELEKGELHFPTEAGLKAFLRAFVAAYNIGDIERIVELVQQDWIDPAVVIGIAQNHMIQNARSKRRRSINTLPTGQLAA